MAFVSGFAPAVRGSRTALRCAARPVAASSFRGARVAAAPAPARAALRMDVEVSEGVTYKINPAVLAISAAGWIIPSSLPAGIPLTGGSGLSQAFFASISANLASWPAGPSAQDPFWTLCFLWHIGMFACAMFGFIGYGMQNDQKA